MLSLCNRARVRKSVLSILMLVVLLASFMTGSAPAAHALEAQAVKQWTFMVYLAADNNLEAAAVADFLEMASAGSNSNVNIVVQFDRIPGYDTRYGDWKTTKRFYVTHGMTPTPASALADMGELNMGSQTTLLNFVTWAKSHYPANKYALILWDHGGGFQPTSEGVTASDDGDMHTQGVSWDDTNGGDYISNKELSTVLASVTSNGAHKMELVAFDACLMAMLEVDQHIKNYANARASSETTEPNAGWPYNTILADLKVHPTWNGISLANDIATRYYASFGNNQTQSSVQFGTAYNTMLTRLNAFANVLRTNMATERTRIAAARTATQHFAYQDNIDLADFAQQVANRQPATAVGNAVKAAALNLHNAIVGVVKNNKHGASWPRAHGTAIFFPRTEAIWGAWAASYQTNQWLARDTTWNDFLNAYFSTNMTITLTWNQYPYDLDGHLWLPAAHPFHVHWNNKGSLSAFPYTLQDVDDTSSYGPENISIKTFYPGTYLYAVYNWSGNSYGTLGASGATVRVYRNGALVRTFTVASASGTPTDPWWRVFTYSGSTITPINTLTTDAGALYDDSPSAPRGATK